MVIKCKKKDDSLTGIKDIPSFEENNLLSKDYEPPIKRIRSSTPEVSSNYVNSRNFNKNSAVQGIYQPPKTSTNVTSTNRLNPVEGEVRSLENRDDLSPNCPNTIRVIKWLYQGAKRATGSCTGNPTDGKDQISKTFIGGSYSAHKKYNKCSIGSKRYRNLGTNETGSFDTDDSKKSTSFSSMGKQRKRKNKKEKHSKKIRPVRRAERILQKIKNATFKRKKKRKKKRSKNKKEQRVKKTQIKKCKDDKKEKEEYDQIQEMKEKEKEDKKKSKKNHQTSEEEREENEKRGKRKNDKSLSDIFQSSQDDVKNFDFHTENSNRLKSVEFRKTQQTPNFQVISTSCSTTESFNKKSNVGHRRTFHLKSMKEINSSPRNLGRKKSSRIINLKVNKNSKYLEPFLRDDWLGERISNSSLQLRYTKSYECSTNYPKRGDYPIKKLQKSSSCYMLANNKYKKTISYCSTTAETSDKFQLTPSSGYTYNTSLMEQFYTKRLNKLVEDECLTVIAKLICAERLNLTLPIESRRKTKDNRILSISNATNSYNLASTLSTLSNVSTNTILSDPNSLDLPLKIRFYKRNLTRQGLVDNCDKWKQYNLGENKGDEVNHHYYKINGRYFYKEDVLSPINRNRKESIYSYPESDHYADRQYRNKRNSTVKLDKFGREAVNPKYHSNSKRRRRLSKNLNTNAVRSKDKSKQNLVKDQNLSDLQTTIKNLSNNNPDSKKKPKREPRVKDESNANKGWREKFLDRISSVFRNRLPEGSRSCCQSKVETLKDQHIPPQVSLGETVVNEANKSKILLPLRTIIHTLKKKDAYRDKTNMTSSESIDNLLRRHHIKVDLLNDSQLKLKKASRPNHEFQLEKGSNSDVEDSDNHSINIHLPNHEILHEINLKNDKRAAILVRKKWHKQEKNLDKSYLVDDNHTCSNSILKRLQDVDYYPKTRSSREKSVKSLSKEDSDKQQEFRPAKIINSEYILLNSDNRLSFRDCDGEKANSIQSCFELDTNNNKKKSEKDGDKSKSKSKKKEKNEKRRLKSKKDEKKDKKKSKSDKNRRKESKSVAIDATSMSTDDPTLISKGDDVTIPITSNLKKSSGLSMDTIDRTIRPQNQVYFSQSQIPSAQIGQVPEKPISLLMNNDITTYPRQSNQGINYQSTSYLPGMATVHNICEEVNQIISNMSRGHCIDPTRDSHMNNETTSRHITREGDRPCLTELTSSLRRTSLMGQISSHNIQHTIHPNQSLSKCQLELTDEIVDRPKVRYEEKDIQDIIKGIQKEIRKQSRSRSKSRQLKERCKLNEAENSMYEDYSATELEENYDYCMRNIMKKLENLEDIKGLVAKRKVSVEKKLNRCRKETYCLNSYQSPKKCFRATASFRNDVDSEKRRLEKALFALNCHQDKQCRPNEVRCNDACCENQPNQHSICRDDFTEYQNNHYCENNTLEDVNFKHIMDYQDGRLLTRTESSRRIKDRDGRGFCNSKLYPNRGLSPVQVHVHVNDYQGRRRHSDIPRFTDNKLASVNNVNSGVALHNGNKSYYKPNVYSEKEVRKVDSRLQMKIDHYRPRRRSPMSRQKDKIYISSTRGLNDCITNRNHTRRSVSRTDKKKIPKLNIRVDSRSKDKRIGNIPNRERYRISKLSQEESVESFIKDNQNVYSYRERDFITYSPKIVPINDSSTPATSFDSRYEEEREPSKIRLRRNRSSSPTQFNIHIKEARKRGLRNKTLKFADESYNQNSNHNYVQLNAWENRSSSIQIEDNVNRDNNYKEGEKIEIEESGEEEDTKEIKNEKEKSSKKIMTRENPNYSLNFEKPLIQLVELAKQFPSNEQSTIKINTNLKSIGKEVKKEICEVTERDNIVNIGKFETDTNIHSESRLTITKNQDASHSKRDSKEFVNIELRKNSRLKKKSDCCAVVRAMEKPLMEGVEKDIVTEYIE
ncbi:DgyrCDS7873 [Dimorphilus gyrociliatus]|uniref:DgyrCDS7873 n=1 Tax=Dimorphilus gyrociliatus TaxID=2664684 RepID=A0A7I8VSH4_9ANNE|nr:DgyrCDS7873 [Dimorphilus gyrociliatus]